MPSRFLTVRASWWLVPAVAMLVLASAMVADGTAGDRVRLGANVLSQSRGGDPLSVLLQRSCDAYDGAVACGWAGAACTSCTPATYTGRTLGGFGGYKDDPVAKVTCGNRQNGTCNAAFQCVPKGVVGTCTPPPQVVVQ